MTNKKLCPLRRLPGGAFDYCQKERCAWYDDLEQRCAILHIDYELSRIREEIRKITKGYTK